MNKWIFLCLVFFTFNSCQSDKKLSDDAIYLLLLSCYEDYYKNYDIEVSAILNQFEEQLLKEKRLSDTTGTAYKELLRSLDKTDYFTPPLQTKNFNKVILYKNPTELLNCAINVFSLDSTEVSNTHFAEIEREIHHKVTGEEEVSIHYFFQVYQTKLSKDEIRKPYIKQNILLLLYRWYYISDQKIKSDKEDSLEE